MKIDFYISSLSGGGAEHVLTNIARNAAEQGHDVSITTFEKGRSFMRSIRKSRLTAVTTPGAEGSVRFSGITKICADS